MVFTVREKKRKQRSPFYTKVLKDGTKQKRCGSKIWYLLKITRSETGQTRTREYFATRSEAKDAEKLAHALNKNEGLSAVEISPQLRAEAIKAADLLAGKATLTEAAAYFMKHAAPSNEITVRELFERYRDYQRAEGASDSYMADINWRLGRFSEYFCKNKMAHEVSYRDITAYLAKPFVRRGKKGQRRIKEQVPRQLSPLGRKIEMKNIRPMFHFALDHGYVQRSPFPARHFRQRKSKDRQNLQDIRVLTLQEVAVVLRNAGELTPHIAIGLFAGVRPDEIKALDWRDVNWETKLILVNARNSTSHDRRYVEMSDNLLAWLNPYKLMEGEISPAKLYRARLTALAKACSLSPWPKDVLRHSFASYWLAKHKDEAKLKHLMGHHQMSDMLKKHYINLISPKDAEIYWGITPAL
jgi:integrase